MGYIVRFIAYYLMPFIVNCITVSILWDTNVLLGLIVIVIALICNVLWAWSTPNRSALTTALLMTFSWIYAVSVRELVRYTHLGWDIILVFFVGILGAVILFMLSLIASSKWFRRSKAGWESQEGKRRGCIISSVVIAISLCTITCFSVYIDVCRNRTYTPTQNFGVIPNLSAKAGFPLGTDGSNVYYKLKGLSTNDFLYVERLELLELTKEVYVSANAAELLDLPIKHLHITYNGEKTVIDDAAKIRKLIIYIRNRENSRPIADGKETVPVHGEDIANAHIVFDLPCKLTWQIEMERTPFGTIWVHMPFDSNVYDVTHILGEYFDL